MAASEHKLTWEPALIAMLQDNNGLQYRVAVPDRPAALQFLADEAAHLGVSVDQARATTNERGFARYVLDCLAVGHLTPSEAANLLDVHYFEFYRMAYDTGALTLSEGFRAFEEGENDEVRRLRGLPDLEVTEIVYRASMEDIYPLYAEVAFDPDRRGAPVMILQHGGYPGTRLYLLPECVRYARMGFFVIAVSKRARDGSAGQGDVWGRETLDIIDALDHCTTQYAEYLDATNVSIMGWSGGGIDSIACAVRFPDRFRCIVPFYGPPDLGLLVDSIAGGQRQTPAGMPDSGSGAEQFFEAARIFSNLLHADLGGPPEEVGDKLLARQYWSCGVNNPYARTFLVWDEQDGGAMYTELYGSYVDEQRRYGYDNTRLVRSAVGDPVRYWHWEMPDQAFLEHHFVPPLLSRSWPAPVLATTGLLRIPGFVKTSRFTVWLGQGDDAVARLHYQLGNGGGRFRFRRLSSDPDVRGRLILHRDKGDVEVTFGLDETIDVPEE